MEEIRVTFNTLTPVWIGDAWGENRDIRPSSLIGSLRFWFEIICYFSGITDKHDYENGKLKDDVKRDKLKEKFIRNGIDFSNIDKALADLGISLPSKIFGCTGWKGWIRIREINNIQKKNEYNYLTGKKLFEELKYEKNGKEKIPAWYFPKGFYGRFTIAFEIEEEIVKLIFYPLLTFMEEYGFWGGKWNLGYGRLEIDKVDSEDNWKKEEFNFSKFKKDNNSGLQNRKFNNLIKEAQSFDDLKNEKEAMLYKLRNQVIKNDLKYVIKELIKIKARMRVGVKYGLLRHQLFGTTKSLSNKELLPQGTKILPWIYKENGQIRGGFISIAGILNL